MSEFWNVKVKDEHYAYSANYVLLWVLRRRRLYNVTVVDTNNQIRCELKLGCAFTLDDSFVFMDFLLFLLLSFSKRKKKEVQWQKVVALLDRNASVSVIAQFSPSPSVFPLAAWEQFVEQHKVKQRQQRHASR